MIKYRPVFGYIAVLRLGAKSGFGKIERQGGARKAERQHLGVAIVRIKKPYGFLKVIRTVY